MLCKIWGETIPASFSEAPHVKGLTESKIDELTANARYFSAANFWRLVFHLPVIMMFWAFGYPLLSIPFLILCTIHAVLVVTEVYKREVFKLYRVDPSATENKEHQIAVTSSRAGDWWYKPKKWETDRFYRWLGMSGFRWFVTTFIEKTRLTRQERKRGERTSYVGKSVNDIVRFESGTRTAESIHLCMASFDLIPVVFCVTVGFWWGLPYTAWVFVGDFWLSLLQRHHRVRVWKIIERVRAREASGLAS
ncbi:hypothetical protein QPK87_31455 [Kamptonema cortianum]|nr:hypothetical protein [Geitlerinema splendidum]MDK3161041.1 hypothetical protein [Kamptonema cortianum]